MAFTPDSPFPKSRGHVIKSKDWNDAITEVRRLDTAKVNRSGGSITGPLTVSGNVGIGLTGPQQALSVGASLNVDQADANNGAVNPGITFGSNSGEGIASRRTTGGNQAGLDLYTGSTARLSITNGGNVGIGTINPQGRLDVGGDIRAGNSDIYFTRTDHNHTGIGNTSGFAAIENAADFDSLMILGRAGTSRGRNVRLWDYLQVNGGMDVAGPVGVGTDVPQVKLHAVGNRIRIDNGGGNILDLRADGSALDLESTGADLFINNNGIPVRIRNQQSVSSRDLKENITDFATEEATAALEALSPVSFTWKDDEEKTRQIGFIAEDAPELARSADEKGIIPMHILAILSKVVSEQQRVISSMRERLLELGDA